MRRLLYILPLSGLLHAQEKISYDDHVFPIFEQSCLNCHNPDKTKGGLDLSTFNGTMKGGSSGKIVEPGDTSSTLVNLAKHSAEPIMPPEGEKLSADKITVIVKWIEGGLLETKSSTARKPSKPKFETTLRSDPSAKPEGPPPMPQHLLLEPPVVTERASAIHSIATSPWAPLLAITGQKQILLYHTETLELIGILPFPEGDPISLAFTPDARYLIVGGGVPGKNGITITFDVTNGSRTLTAGKEFDSILASDIRPSFDIVATGGPSKLLKLWDTSNGEQVQSIKKHTDWITALDISPDGILLASGDRNGGVWVWEAESAAEFHTLRGHQAGITTLAYRSDSNILASSSEDGTVRYWEMNNGNEIKKIDAHKGGVTAFSFAKNGTSITAGRDNMARIWKPDFNKLRDIKLPSLPNSAAISHDGKRAFIADAYGAIHTFPIEGKGQPEITTFFNNPQSIETRSTLVTARIDEVRESISTSLAANEERNKNVQKAIDYLAAAEKKLEQTKNILKASEKGVNEANQALNRLKSNKDTPQEEFNKAKAALTAAMKQRDAARARLEPAKNKLNEARKVADQARRPAPPDKSLEDAEAELATLLAREKSLAAAAINTRVLAASDKTQTIGLTKQDQLATFRQSLTDLATPTAALNQKRAERAAFASAFRETNLAAPHLAEAQATLRALDTSVENLTDTLHQQETALATVRQSIDTSTRELLKAQSEAEKLRDTYLQALK
ncbi:MAG: c-type cytochrome domain-containing protein [Luteolibacter sp.]